MTDFQEISKDDNHVTVRFKQGKHEYDVMIDYGVIDRRGETEAAVSFSITEDPNPDWREQGITQTFSVNNFAQFLNKLKEISTYDDEERTN